MRSKFEDRKSEEELQEYLGAVKEAEARYNGMEADEENEAENFDLPYDVTKIRVDQKMITVFQIEHWIRSDILDLRPDYQRNLVWDNRRKTALIESLMLQIPIPAFYLDESSDGKKHVIDGMQRLSTIHEFLNDEFPLRKMQYLSNFEGRVFSQLDQKFRAYIEDTMLTVNILDERCPQMVKFDVFRRVNTGGIPLNPQEIRNIMAFPSVRKLLKDMCRSEEFQAATNYKVKDVRMGAQELCLRYLTVLDTYSWQNREFVHYYGLLKTMDAEIISLNGRSSSQLTDILNTFRAVMLQCGKLLAGNSFCKPGSTAVNKSLFTGWAVALTHMNADSDRLYAHTEAIRKKYLLALSEDGDFYRSVTSSTGTKKNIQYSIEAIRKILEETL